LLSLTRLASCALHAGQSARARKLFAQAAVSATELPDPERAQHVVAELRAGAAETALDLFDAEAARAELAELSVEWEPVLAARLHDPEVCWTLVHILGRQMRLALFDGDVERGVSLQRRVLRLVPHGERARSRADLGECLRRAGQFDEAEATFAEAEGDLRHMPESYRDQTEAFLLFHRARTSLDARRPVQGLTRMRALVTKLPESSAGRWRVRFILAVAALRSSKSTQLTALERLIGAETSEFRRWHLGVGLLHVARWYPKRARAARKLAGATLGPLASYVAKTPTLSRSARVLAGLESGDAQAAAQELTGRCAY
jgi:tetratricopeptide (TPR) repeat protein